jgi:hypothetical protein
MRCSLAVAAALASALLVPTGCKDKTHEDGARKPTAAGSGEETAAPETAAPAPAQPATLPPDTGDHEGKLAWAHRFGGPDRDAARGVAIDDDGNVIVAGYCSDGAELGGDHPAKVEGIDACVIKRAADGTFAWSHVLGGAGDDIGNAVAVTPGGDVVVAGSFAEELDLGDAKLASGGADDVFVVALDPEGHRKWAARFGGRDVDAAENVAVTEDGGVIVTGVFRQTAAFATDELVSAGDADIFVARLSPAGKLEWARRFGGSGPDYGRAVAIDASGHIGLLAEFSGEADFGATHLTSAGNRDLVLARLDRDGAPVWAKQYGNNWNEVGVGLAADPAGNLIATGSFDVSIDFGDGELESKGRSDAFVAKFSPDGALLWSKRFGDKDEDIGADVATDAHGNIAATGWFWYEPDLGGGPVESAGKKDVYLVLLAPSGEHLWSHRFGAEGSDQGRAVAIDGDGRVAVAGTFRNEVDFGGTTLSFADDDDDVVPHGDGFVAVLSR